MLYDLTKAGTCVLQLKVGEYCGRLGYMDNTISGGRLSETFEKNQNYKSRIINQIKLIF